LQPLAATGSIRLEMLRSVHPKLPMRQVAVTRSFYTEKLGFTVTADYGNYLIVEREKVEWHFFEFVSLDPKENYGQVYIRVSDIDQLHRSFREAGVPLLPKEQPESKPWGQREFSLLDPDHNLLTFGQEV